jgi:transposase
MTAYHVGIDLHKSVAQVCVRNAQGAIHEERRCRLDHESQRIAFVEWLQTFGAHGRFAVEALGCNRWFVLALRQRGLEIVVANPTKLHLKQAGKKTDKRDAREIARRLHLGDLDRHARTYFATEEEYGLRKLIRITHKLTQMRTSLVAQIRGLLNAYAIRPPAKTLYIRGSIAWLRELDLGGVELNEVLQALVDLLETTHHRVARLRSRIRRSAQAHEKAQPMVRDLMQVGDQTALTVVAELGDVDRFEQGRAVSSYLGVVPRVTASGDRAHHGRLTRRGNQHLRYIMGQWAVRLLTHDPRVQKWAEPMLRRMHKNKVRMALARRLAVGVWVMLTRGEAFSMERCLNCWA